MSEKFSVPSPKPGISPIIHKLRSGRSFQAKRKSGVFSKDIRIYLSPLKPTTAAPPEVVVISPELPRSSSPVVHLAPQIFRPDNVTNLPSGRTVSRQDNIVNVTNLPSGRSISRQDNIVGFVPDEISAPNISSVSPVIATARWKSSKRAVRKAKKTILQRSPVSKSKSITPSMSNIPVKSEEQPRAQSAVPLSICTRSRSNVNSDKASLPSVLGSKRTFGKLKNSQFVAPPPVIHSKPPRPNSKPCSHMTDTVRPLENLVVIHKGNVKSEVSPLHGNRNVGEWQVEVKSETSLVLKRTSDENTEEANEHREGDVKVEESLLDLSSSSIKDVKRASSGKSDFDYLRKFFTSKFEISTTSVNSIANIRTCQGGKTAEKLQLQSLRLITIAVCFGIISKFSKKSPIFSNQILCYILPRVESYSKVLRKRPVSLVNLIEFMSVIACDHRSNVHVLKYMVNILVKMVGIGANPNTHALVENVLSSRLPTFLRAIRVDWQAVHRLVKSVFFKNKLALRQIGCFLLFDRLKSLIGMESRARFEVLEPNDKIVVGHISAVLSSSQHTNLVTLKPRSRAFGIVKILGALVDHLTVTSELEGDWSGIFDVVRASRKSGRQSMKGYEQLNASSAARLLDEDGCQPIIDEWESLYDAVSQLAIESNFSRFSADGYESLLSATPLISEQRRIIYVYESDPELDSDGSVVIESESEDNVEESFAKTSRNSDQISSQTTLNRPCLKPLSRHTYKYARRLPPPKIDSPDENSYLPPI